MLHLFTLFHIHHYLLLTSPLSTPTFYIIHNFKLFIYLIAPFTLFYIALLFDYLKYFVALLSLIVFWYFYDLSNYNLLPIIIIIKPFFYRLFIFPRNCCSEIIFLTMPFNRNYRFHLFTRIFFHLLPLFSENCYLLRQFHLFKPMTTFIK